MMLGMDINRLLSSIYKLENTETSSFRNQLRVKQRLVCNAISECHDVGRWWLDGLWVGRLEPMDTKRRQNKLD